MTHRSRNARNGCRMRFALIDGEKSLPSPKARGRCPTCNGEVQAKCGKIKVWHWAHVAGDDCDTWSEPLGPWHLSWQNLVAPEHIEVVKGQHRADIVGMNDVVIELQHSSINADDIQDRERFYERMVWLFDATERFRFVRTGQRGFFTLGQVKHVQCCSAPVFLDFGTAVIQVERFDERVINGASGFGLLRNRNWFVDQYLRDRVTAQSGPPPAPEDSLQREWSADRPARKWMPYPTGWCRPDTSAVQVLAKGETYLPLDYVWPLVDGGEQRAADRIIERCTEIANGWTAAELDHIRRALGGFVAILDGLLRLVPSSCEELSRRPAKSEPPDFPSRVDSHVAAGRIPVLQEKTREEIVRLAMPKPVSKSKSSSNGPSQLSLGW